MQFQKSFLPRPYGHGIPNKQNPMHMVGHDDIFVQNHLPEPFAQPPPFILNQ